MIKKLILCLFVLSGCNNNPNLVKEFIANDNQSIEEILEAELLHTEEGKLKVKILAGKIERFGNRQPELIFSKNLEMYFYNDSAQIQSTLYSNNAEIDRERKIMLAYDNVRLISSDNKQLETDELIWDEENNKIYTEKDIKIITGKEIIYGQGFFSNPDFTKYEIINITGTFDFQEEIN